MKTLIVTVSVVALLLAGICSVEADPGPFTAFLTDTRSSGVGLTTQGTHGWSFTTTAPLTINSLGFFDSSEDGLISSHDIGLWNSTETLLGSATVPFGTSATLENGFRWVPVSPISLDAGQTYVVGAVMGGTDDDTVLKMTEADDLEFDQAISFVEGLYAVGGTLIYPWNDSISTDTTYLSANFKGNVVPIPSALWLLGSGLIGLLGVRRRFRKG